MTEQKTQWQQKLAESRAGLLALLQDLTPDQWTQVVFSEGAPWTVTTVVSHLLDSERGMSIQIHKTRKGEETVPPGFDIDRWNAGVQKRVGDLSPAELLASLVATRAKTLEVMNSLQAEDWARIGRHPARGLITIAQYYETIYEHELTHTRDIQAALG
ncbi:MAG: DinB family protein [Caldilineaceae bacterium]|nr:DinB family protein [Caldilineaceae bacterium]